MDHLLARFRPLPDNAPPTATPTPPGQEVVRYQPPATQRETRSQLDRVARADAGDLQARLDLIPINAVEEALARRFCKQQPDRSILAYLQEPGEGIERCQAAATILEELADKTEDSAYESALVFRYIQKHSLWKYHPNSAVQSAESLIQHLNGSDYVQANIIIGTSAQVAKRNCIRLIDEKWGAGWFEQIPNDMRHPSWGTPEGCSKRLLTEMAANAKQGYLLEDAIEAWAEAICRRNDYGERRRLGIKSKTTRYIIPEDVASLNRIANDEDRGRRTSDMFFPDEAKEDRLKVEIIAPTSASTKIATPPNYTDGRRPNSTKTKRKRVQEVEQEESGSEEQWRESTDGKWMTKRVRNHLVRKPVEEIPETEGSRPSSPEQLQRDTSTQSSEQSSPTPQPTSRSMECEGPAFAAAIGKMLGLFSELKNPMYTVTRCCDKCRGPLQRAVDCIQKDFAPIITDLENVSTHAFGDEEALSTQDHGISPYRPRKQRNPIIVRDDSDVG